MPQVKDRKVSITQRAQAMALLEYGVTVQHCEAISGLSRTTLYALRKRMRERGYDPRVSTMFEDHYFKDAPRTGRPRKEGSRGSRRRAAEAEKARLKALNNPNAAASDGNVGVNVYDDGAAEHAPSQEEAASPTEQDDIQSTTRNNTPTIPPQNRPRPFPLPFLRAIKGTNTSPKPAAGANKLPPLPVFTGNGVFVPVPVSGPGPVPPLGHLLQPPNEPHLPTSAAAPSNRPETLGQGNEAAADPSWRNGG